VRAAYPGRVQIMEQRWIHNQAQLDAFYDEALENGYEGVVLKDPSGFYKWGKCTAKEGIQYKIKPENDAEAMVTGFYEAEENQNEQFINEIGEHKRSTHQAGKVGKGTLGGFLAKDVATGRDIRVPCGKMKHSERQHVWDNQAQYMGEFFTYRSMGYGELNQPRQARWYRWRHVVDMEATGA
jgi:DNA ligase-1